jgi:large subunit ribosomal protein L4
MAIFDAGVFSAPSTKQAAKLLTDWDSAQVSATTLVVLHESEEFAGKSFRNLPQVVVLPAEDAGVANVIGAARLLVSEAALPVLVARANGTVADEEGEN